MALFYVIAFCLFLRCVAMEPLCSKFEYDQKMLYKLVKMEFEWQEIQSEVKTSLTNVETELANVKLEISEYVKNISEHTDAELVKMKSEWQKLQSEIKTALINAKQTISDDVKNITDEIRNSIGKQKEDILEIVRGQEGQITELRQNSIDFIQQIRRNISDLDRTTKMVAFNVRDVKDHNPASGDTIIFTTTLMNEGDAYDSSMGIFAAPVSGLYMFTVQLCSKHDISAGAKVIIGGQEYGTLYSYDVKRHHCSSCQASAVMQSGDTAYVRNVYDWVKLYADINRLSYFTGTLIHQTGSGSN